MNQTEKNIVIVGGSSGLGKVISKQFASAGQRVAIVSRNIPDFAAESTFFTHFHADLSNFDISKAEDLVAKISQKCGRISYLIFCQRYRGPNQSLSNEIAVSLTSTAAIIDAFADYFVTEGDKAIGVVSSVYGDYVGSSQSLDYHMVKSALSSLVRYYSVNLGSKGIRVNAISPLTYLKEESKHVYLNDPNKLAKYRKLVPLGRMGTAEECANVIRFLCSNQSTFVTGQNLYVDGGVSVIWPEELA